MFSFFKKLFGKKEKKARKPAKSARSASPVNFNVDDKINVHKDEAVPKLWKGVVNSVSATYFSVDIPELMGEFPFPFKEGESISVSMVKGEKTCKFMCKLAKISWKSKPPILILEFPEEVTWEESRPREYIRISTDMPAKVRHIEKKEGGWQMVRIVDFSLTGVLIRSPKPFVIGDKLEVNFLSYEFPLKPKTTVMWSTKDEESSKDNVFNVGLKFYDLTEVDRQMMASYAYKLQRKSFGGP